MHRARWLQTSVPFGADRRLTRRLPGIAGSIALLLPLASHAFTDATEVTAAARAEAAEPTVQEHQEQEKQEKPQAQETPPQEEAAQQRFDIDEIRVLGNTKLPNTSIESAVYPYLGPGKTIADVETARQKLERMYRDAGYATVFVDIPEQRVDSGIVRLRVTEGRIDRVRVTGARYYSNRQIRLAVPSIRSGEVPHFPAVQEQLNTLNRVTADRSIVPVLKAGRAPGTVDVELKVKDELPLHASVEINDRYTADTTRLRLNASLSYDNLFQRQHRVSVQFQTAPEETRDMQAYVGTYSFPMPALEDLTIALYAVDSRTDIATLGTLSVIGNGRIYGLRALYALPASADYLHNVSFGVEYKDMFENVRLDPTQQIETPIRYLNWSANYAGTLKTERTVTGFNIGTGLGVRGAVNTVEAFENKRFKGAANYFYLRGGIQHLRQLPLGLQAFGRLSGQFSPSPLVNSEQFAAGGVDSVRGYLESAQLGDYGFNGTVELRSGWPLRPLHLPPGAAYVFTFYDAGIVAIVDPLPGQARRFDLASWGVGLRVGGWRGLDLALDWAHAFTPAGPVGPGDERAHFSFAYAF